MGSVESFAPGFIPVEELGVEIKTLGKVFFAELFDEGRIGEIRLGDEFFRGAEVFFFLPVNGDLRFGELRFGGGRSGFGGSSFRHGGGSRKKECS